MRSLLIDKLLGELLISDGTATLGIAINEAIKSGKLRKLAPTIYTTAIEDSDELIIKRNLYTVLGVLYPDAIISHRSAIEIGPRNGHIVLTYKYTKKIRLPGITVHLMKGMGPLPGDIPFEGGLNLASSERSWLENLVPTKAHDFRKTFTKKALDEYLVNFLDAYGLSEIDEKMSKAKRLSASLGFTAEIAELENMIHIIKNRFDQARITESLNSSDNEDASIHP